MSEKMTSCFDYEQDYYYKTVKLKNGFEFTIRALNRREIRECQRLSGFVPAGSIVDGKQIEKAIEANEEDLMVWMAVKSLQPKNDTSEVGWSRKDVEVNFENFEKLPLPYQIKIFEAIGNLQLEQKEAMEALSKNL